MAETPDDPATGDDADPAGSDETAGAAPETPVGATGREAGKPAPRTGAQKAAAGLGMLIGLAVLGLIGLGIRSLFTADMNISAFAEFRDGAGSSRDEGADTPRELVVRGRVLSDGNPIEGALVWVVAADSRGNQLSPPSVRSSASGEFELTLPGPGVAALEETDANTVITVSSTKERPWYQADLSAEARIVTRAQAALVQLMPRAQMYTLLAMVGVFGLCLFFLFVRFRWPDVDYAILAGTLVLPALMVVAVGWGMHNFGRSFRSGDVISLGFLNVYEGSYVEGMPKEWLVSFTAVPDEAVGDRAAAPHGEGKTGAAATRPAVEGTPGRPRAARGFGAPLWVLLLSIVGAALFAFAFVLSEHRKLHGPPGSDARVATTKRMVEHQFYMFFAPLGGVFLYQLLVVSSMAAEPVTVAVLALGAGVSLNLLLEKTSRRVAAVLGKGGGTKGVDATDPP